MSKLPTASGRSALIKLAHELPQGSDERKAILSGLRKAMGPGPGPGFAPGGPGHRASPADPKVMVKKTAEALDLMAKAEKLLSSVGSGGGRDTGNFPDDLPDTWHGTYDEVSVMLSKAKGRTKRLLRLLQRI
jgi:hypothetical protein